MTPDFPELPELEIVEAELQGYKYHFISQLFIKLHTLFYNQKKRQRAENKYAEDIFEPNPYPRIRSISVVIRDNLTLFVEQR